MGGDVIIMRARIYSRSSVRVRSSESDKGSGTARARVLRRYPRKVRPVAQSCRSYSGKLAEGLEVSEVTQ